MVLLTACCGVFVGFGSVLVFTFGVFLKPLSAEFGWTRSQISLAFTVAALTVAFCSPVIGRLLDRYPAQRVIIPCTAIYGVAFASLSLLTAHFWHLLIVFALLGIVGNGTTQLGYARVVSAWFDRARGRALAAVMAGSATGAMVFPPLAQWIISSLGWRPAYAILGATILLFGIPLPALFLRMPPGTEPRPPGSGQLSGTIRHLLDWRFIGIVSALLLFSLATNGLNAHWAPLLTDAGFPAQQAAMVLSVAGLASLLSRFLTGYLIDRFFASRVAAVLLAVSGVGFLFVIFGRSVWSAFAAAILVGIGLGAESDSVPFLLTRYFGLERFSELYGYSWSVYAVAGALGPLAAGIIFDNSGSYRVALLSFLGMVVLASAIFALLPRYRRAA